MLFKKIELGSCSGGMVNVVIVPFDVNMPVLRKGSSRRMRGRLSKENLGGFTD